MTVPEIGRQRSTSRQNIQILVDKLAESGHVELVPNPAHKRSALVRLTARGKDWLQSTEPEYLGFLSTIEAELTPEEIESGLSVLRKILNRLSAEPAPRKAPQTRAKKPATRSRHIPEPVSEPVGATSPEEEFPVNLL